MKSLDRLFDLAPQIQDLKDFLDKCNHNNETIKDLTNQIIKQRDEARGEALTWKAACMEAVAQRNEAREATRIAVDRLSLYGGEFWREELIKKLPWLEEESPQIESEKP